MKNIIELLKTNKITEVECIVPDMAGVSRGKIMPAEKFTAVYTAIKETEYETFMRVISPWEREYLLLNV